MKTFFEITANKTYKQLTLVEKNLIQDRQTHLVKMWQDTNDLHTKLEIEDELIASFEGLVNGIAIKQANKSFSVDFEEFKGIISLVLAETMVDFDRTLNKPFQPVFIMNVRYAILEMYREKGYDLHDTADKLDQQSTFVSQYDNEERETFGDTPASNKSSFDDIVTQVSTEKILNDLFGANDRKKTIVLMAIEGFKRNEIVSAVAVQGKSTDSMAKYVNRTLTQFKSHFIALKQVNLV